MFKTGVCFLPVKKPNPAKDDYRRLRLLSCEELWDEVEAFDRSDATGRLRRVSVVRAVGVVFSETGTNEEQLAARGWLKDRLRDPEEKIRRYAMTALPKLGGDPEAEAGLLELLENPASDRETQALNRSLEKVGGSATLAGRDSGRLSAETLRKVATNVVRAEQPGRVCLDGLLEDFSGLQIHLRCREGLEDFVADELDEHVRAGAPFRRVRCEPGLVVVVPRGPFRLEDLFALRCFAQVGFVPGPVRDGGDEIEVLAALVASPTAHRLLTTFTEGPVRYRLEFVSKGHQRAAIRRVADRVHALNPELWNDSREALWQIDVRHGGRRRVLEISPRLRPDPRFSYRQGDVPAASHPPLAACLVRLAGRMADEVVWDPFCGSGLELIERARVGGVASLIGSDVSDVALETARRNLDAAAVECPIVLKNHDLRDFATMAEVAEGGVSLILTNPPLGRRVPIPDLPGLIRALFEAASAVLRPGGRLVFVNPRAVEPIGLPLVCEDRRRVDLGGFHCHLEKYTRVR